MDSQWEGSIPDHPYLPSVSKSVYILGCKYDSLDGKCECIKYPPSFVFEIFVLAFAYTSLSSLKTLCCTQRPRLYLRHTKK
ncbi:uncharacterized protein DC041_0012645 [Schistosoma bovis]|uniref:Uncharacterized protein n=1 Tax=Schistosoma bovis TaxID=6184 RepID=A0A430Q2W8_SCHBO|nr:uncharacterized protein DC041_0012645 [Schistosoma bovis]